MKAPDVTRRRMYMETMERVFGDMNKVILDGVSGGERGQGVVPFLPLNELGRMQQAPAAGCGHDGRDQLMNAHPSFIPASSSLVRLALSSVFIVDEREKALVLQFGQVKAVKEEPGLGFKIPLIQEVVRYDGRILGLPTQPLEVTPLDDRRLVVDAFARWQIVTWSSSAKAVGVGGIRAAQTRLERILNAAIREVLGSVPSDAVLSEDRTGPDEPHPRSGAARGGCLGCRRDRRAPDAHRPARAEPRRDLCADAGRTGTRGDGRDRPR